MSANNRVYLLGAGFSMAVSAEGDVSDEFKMPSMQQLSKAVLDDVKQSRPRLPNLSSTEEAAYDAPWRNRCAATRAEVPRAAPHLRELVRCGRDTLAAAFAIHGSRESDDDTGDLHAPVR